VYALILAGGQGTRLWPRSRHHLPKQLLDLASPRTMLQETYDRLGPSVPADQVYVITNAACRDEVVRQLPAVPPANVIVEPSGKNTAPAVGLGCLPIRRRDPEAMVAVLSADHIVQRPAEFRSVVAAAVEQAERGYLVTIGITPSRPETGYGYIELGAPLEHAAPHSAHRVARFTEKPDLERARQFLAGGRHLWNAGMFVWRVDRIFSALEQHLPALAESLDAIAVAQGTATEPAALDAAWAGVQAVSIDVGVMEKDDRVAVIPAEIGWSDVGTWASLAQVIEPDEDGNVVLGADHLHSGTTGSLIYGERRLIATIGLQDFVVVDTDDALLICPKDRSQDVKELVDRLRAENRTQYL